MPHYETTISFSYDAETPAEAARLFVANIAANPGWVVDVRDTDTGAVEQIDTEEAPEGDATPHIEIRFDDGETHRVPVRIDPEAVSVGGGWAPGIVLTGAPPRRCYFQADYFECAVGEGGETGGKVVPEEADMDDAGRPSFDPFTWRLVGVTLPTSADPVRHIEAADASNVRAVNLRTEGDLLFVGISPEQAVIAAYAQEHSDYSTWGYAQRYGHLVERGKRTVACGDWCAKLS